MRRRVIPLHTQQLCAAVLLKITERSHFLMKCARGGNRKKSADNGKLSVKITSFNYILAFKT
jgi:hypothetical protein